MPKLLLIHHFKANITSFLDTYSKLIMSNEIYDVDFPKQTKTLDYAPVICIPGPKGAGDTGDVAGLKCRNLTSDVSRQCRGCAGV